MTTDKQQDEVSVRVINEEYERVLSNPENLIVSEALQELIDMPMSNAGEGLEAPRPEASLDTLVVTILDSDGLGVSVRGNLSELSCIGPAAYKICVETENVREEFLSALERYTHKASETGEAPLILGGNYNTELKAATITAWSIKKSGPHMLNLELVFRSEDVIF